MYRTLLVCLLLVLGFATASPRDRFPKPEFVSKQQKKVLSLACKAGKRIDKGKGEMCQVFQAIAWVESRAGLHKGDKPKHYSYGTFQSYRKTVRDRLRQRGIYKTYDEVKRMLMDDETSAYWAEVEIRNWLRYHKGDVRKTLASYNGGYRWKKTLRYADEVLAVKNYIKKAKHLK